MKEPFSNTVRRLPRKDDWSFDRSRIAGFAALSTFHKVERPSAGGCFSFAGHRVSQAEASRRVYFGKIAKLRGRAPVINDSPGEKYQRGLSRKAAEMANVAATK